MARFRPRGSKGQRIIGKAVSKGLNEYYKGRPKKENNGCLIAFAILLLLFIIINGTS